MSQTVRRISAIAVSAFAVALVSTAAQRLPGQGLPDLIRGNEQFGRALLLRVHAAAPDRNIVLSPLSVSIVFAALQENATDAGARKEIGTAFGWGDGRDLGVPARMLLAAFREPERIAVSRGVRPGRPSLDRVSEPETAWITNILLYRATGTLSDWFVKSATRDFGFGFASTGARKPTGADLRGARPSAGALPSLAGTDDVLIHSSMHLQTAWEGNTFSLSKPFRAEFRPAAGPPRSVEMLTSEFEMYPYAKTESFEAVALPCNTANLVAVLPAPGKSIADLERDLVERPESLDMALKRRAGTVDLPPFRIRFEASLREFLTQMGIREVFDDLGSMVRIRKSHLTGISQRIGLDVDRLGIRADAETVGGAIYGGIGGGEPAFQMRLDRPFIFLVRDKTTNALLFIGAVMDPTRNQEAQ